MPRNWIKSSLGIAKAPDGGLSLPTVLPQGFGDHRELLTSMLATQHAFLNGQLASQASQELHHRGVLTKRETLIVGHTFPGRLHDRAIRVPGVEGTLYLTDASVLKAVKTMPIEELLRASINLTAFRLPSLLALQGTAGLLRQAPRSSNSALASWRSAVAKPSVNQP